MSERADIAHFSAAELAGLPGMPSTRRAVQYRAEADHWPSRPRQGRGGGREYPITCLPTQTREALLARSLAAAASDALPAEAPPTAPAGAVYPVSSARPRLMRGRTETARPVPPPADEAATVAQTAPSRAVGLAELGALTHEQRSCAWARLALLDAAHAIARDTGVSQTQAYRVIGQQAARGVLPDALRGLVPVANARANASRSLSASALHRWAAAVHGLAAGDLDSRLAALAPKVPTPALDLPSDVLGVLALVDASGRSLAAATRRFARAHGFEHDHAAVQALYHRASRALRSKVPAHIIDRRRHTGAALAAKRPYVSRDRSGLLPNDIWQIDGHAMKAKWAHPETGKPFVPELTLVKDWATGRVLAYSVALSENALAVREALIKAISEHGVPGIVYSDGGSGETARELDDERVGLYRAFGIDHRIGRPGHPQGRGLIERDWANHAIEVARDNPTFRGHGADPERLRRAGREIDRALRAAASGRGDPGVVVPMTLLPPLRDLFERLDREIAAFNGRPSRALPIDPATGQRHSPDSLWASKLGEAAIERVQLGAQQIMFFPFRLVPVRRGRITLFGNYYAADALYELAEGKTVRAHFDVTRVERVWISTPEGRYLCEAVLNGATRDAFPASVVEASRLRRLNNQAKRLAAKQADVEAERAGVLAYIVSGAPSEEPPAMPEPVLPRPAPDADAVGAEATRAPSAGTAIVAGLHPRPIFRTDAQRYQWLVAHRGVWTDADRSWISDFVAGGLYAQLEPLFEDQGIAWHQIGEGADPGVFKEEAA